MTNINSEPAQSEDEPVKVASPPKVPLRILIADDHQIVREGVKAVLERGGFKVIAQASDGQEAVGRTLELQPDVAVLDLILVRFQDETKYDIMDTCQDLVIWIRSSW